jgi:hypothetical protein
MSSTIPPAVRSIHSAVITPPLAPHELTATETAAALQVDPAVGLEPTSVATQCRFRRLGVADEFAASGNC